MISMPYFTAQERKAEFQTIFPGTTPRKRWAPKKYSGHVKDQENQSQGK